MVHLHPSLDLLDFLISQFLGINNFFLAEIRTPQVLVLVEVNVPKPGVLGLLGLLVPVDYITGSVQIPLVYLLGKRLALTDFFRHYKFE